MRLDRIRLKNFFNHRDTDIDLTEVESPTLITGPNGAGKTSLFIESVCYAVFGQTRLETADECILNEEDEMSVEVVFTMGGQEVAIKRSKKRGKTQKLEMHVDGVKVDELLTETQKRIDKMFGLSYESFRSSSILRQDDSNFFVKAKPDERKKIIGEILDLGQYERYEKLAKEKRAEIKAEIKADQAILDSIEDIDVDSLSADLKKVEKFLSKQDTKISAAQAELDEIWEWNAGVTEQQKRYDEVAKSNASIEAKITQGQKIIKSRQAEYDEIQEFLAGWKDPQKFLTKAENAIEELQQAYTEEESKSQEAFDEKTKLIEFMVRQLEPQIELVSAEAHRHKSDAIAIGEKERKLAKIETASCPTCLRELSDDERRKMLQDLEIEREGAQAEADKFTEQLQVLRANKAKHQRGDFPEAEALQDKIVEAGNAMKEIKESIRQAKIAYKEKIEQQQAYSVKKERANNLLESISDAKEAIASLEEQIRELPQVTLKPKSEVEAKELVNELRGQKEDAIAIKAQIEQNIESGLKSAHRKKQATDSVISNKKRLALVEKLCTAFSRKGIPAAIIETVLPEIEASANEYLAKMSENGFQIEFHTVEVLKNGEQRDTLDIAVHDGNVWRSFDSFSGGEQFRVSLSIRLALSKVLTNRAGVELELLILDEPAAALDPSGREDFCSTIKALGNIFSRIIIMSHIRELMDEFENRIHVVKLANGESKVG